MQGIDIRTPTKALKAGTVELSFIEKAKDLGVYNTPEFKSLKNLNEDELKLFLIMGGQDANYYRFTNTKLTPLASQEQFSKLAADSLLNVRFISQDTTMILPTDVGKKLHKALLQSIYSELIKIKN